MLEWLFERFEGWGGKEAVVWRETVTTFRDLLHSVQEWKREFAVRGIGPGTVASLEDDFSPASVALLLAMVDSQFVAVPLTPTWEQRKPELREIAEVSAVFSRDSQKEWTISPVRREGTHHGLLRQLAAKHNPGLVLFSSGTTGQPKAALHDFVPLLEKFRKPRHSLRTITFLLLDHIGGLNTLFYVLANGGTAVTVESRNPDVVCAAIEKNSVELLPTSPTFLNLLLLSEAHLRYDLSSLRQISYGTEPMPESTLKRIHAAFPAVKLLQTYGLSEVGILSSRSKSSDSLFFKIGGEGFETRVVDGTLRIRARSSMLGFLNAPSPFDAEGWLDTGDLVEVEGEYLRILGRRSEVINVGGEKVHPAEVESVIMEMNEVADASVRGVPNPITGNMVVARIRATEPIDCWELRKRVRDHCKKRLAAFKVPAKVEQVCEPLHSGRFKKMRRADA